MLTQGDVVGLHDEIVTELFGTVSVPREVAEAMVRDHWTACRIAPDDELLQWLESLPEGSDRVRVPESSVHEDRLCFVIAELIAHRGDITVECNRCEAEVPPERIVVEEKCVSEDVSGIRVGFAGDLYLCPERHGLFFVATKIF